MTQTRQGSGAAAQMPYRRLGRTGEKVSLIGLGGYHIGIQKEEQESIRWAARSPSTGVRQCVSAIVSALMFAFLLAIAPRLVASEADELREKAQAMKREAVELKERGRIEAAEDLARKAAELAEAAERLEGKRPKVSEEEIEKLHGQLKDLLDKERRMKEANAPEKDLDEIREQIAKTERKLDGLRIALKLQREGSKGPVPHPDLIAKLEETGRRIKHFRIAAENLHAAGADDLAKQLMEKAEFMEQEARETKMRMIAEAEHRAESGMGGIPAQIDELRREVSRLQEEMKELGQHVKELERAKR